MKHIDLHTHSLISDGTYSPADLIKLAAEKGLAAIALTDHESIAGDEEAAKEAKRLGLGFDETHPSFRQMYDEVRSSRESNIKQIIGYVAARGVKISEELVRPFAGGQPIDRYAITRYMLSLGQFDGLTDIWRSYLDVAVKELNINFNIAADVALPLVREAGGVGSLAHFHKAIGLGGLTRAEQADAIARLHAMGLRGMERYYPNYTAEDEAFAAAMIEKHRLIPTGGSDFHGANRPGVELGSGINDNLAVPYEFFQRIKDNVAKAI